MPWGVRPPHPGQRAAKASGSATVVLSCTTTPANRRSSGTATGSASTTAPTAAASTRASTAAAAGVKRWSSPCGLIPTPRAAAVWVS